MTLKRLLVPLDGKSDAAPALSTALAIAKKAGAHVDALFVASDPRVETGVADYLGPSVILSIEQETQAENARRRRQAKKLFDRLVRQQGAKVSDKPGAPTASAAYIELTGIARRLIADLGRLYDLIVVGQTAKRDKERDASLAAVLEASGRPVLITRTPLAAGFAGVIAIAWNGSIEVTRAVAAAMPFLEQAKKVVVFTVEGDTRYGPPASQLIGYLEWHGISATAASLRPRRGHAATALLAAAEKHSADLMVLGAYTRGELRRLVFGGVTEAVLATSSLPLLMTH